MPPADHDPTERILTFGFNKGKALGECSTKDLEGLRRWCAEKDDEKATNAFGDLINDIDEVLSDRRGLELGL